MSVVSSMWVPSISRIINSRAGRKVRWHPVNKTMLQNRPLSLTAPPTQLISQFYSLLLHRVEMSSPTHFTVLSWISYNPIPLTNCERLQGINIMLVFTVPSIVSDILENNLCVCFFVSFFWESWVNVCFIFWSYMWLFVFIDIKIICMILLFPSDYLSKLKPYTTHLNRISFQLLSIPVNFWQFHPYANKNKYILTL